MQFCQECGAKNSNKAKFCQQCGTKFLFRDMPFDKIIHDKPSSTRSRSKVDKSTRFSVDTAEKESIISDESCPVCGKVSKEDRFECKRCGRDNICTKHQDIATLLCEGCIRSIIGKEEGKPKEKVDMRQKKKEKPRRVDKPKIVDEPKKVDEQELTVIHKSVEFVRVIGGEYYMGDVFGDGLDREKPVHRVKLDSFYMGKYPVTFDQYDIFCEATGYDRPSDGGWGRGTRPVINVGSRDARAYCDWLSAEMGKMIRLPTEAQWEYAAREGGKKIKWSGTNDENIFGQYAWYKANSREKTQLVGKKKPNGLGLHDMSGNVWEWCFDLYDENYYKISSYHNPQGSSSGKEHVLRGGSWGSNIENLRCSYRFIPFPGGRYIYSGFRCAMII